jgi:T5SS/PEP-CTERM-associated repeat protein
MLAVVVAGLMVGSAAQAALTFTGDISPATDPSTWVGGDTGGSNSYIGNTGIGSITVNGGSSLLSRFSEVGTQATATGTATVTGSGSTWTLGMNMFVGYSGKGTLAITNGGFVNSSTIGSTGGYIGYNAGSSGAVTVDGLGSTWTNTGNLYVARSASGKLSITNGGAVSNATGNIAYYSGTLGVVAVNGSNSTWTNNGSLNIGYTGYTGVGKLSISDGGAVTASTVSINASSTLTTDLGKGSTLAVSGTLTNNGAIRMAAGARTANGAYAPITAGTWAGTGAVQALGGVWNGTDHTVTVSSAATAAAGVAKTIDLSTTQRVLVTDAATGKSVGASFMAAGSPANLTFSAITLNGSTQSLLQRALASGQGVLSGWTFSTEGYTAGDPVYLSLSAGSGHSLSDLAIWHYDGSSWAKYAASDLAYDNTYASFTVTGFSGYAVTGTVPVPPTVWLFGSGLIGLVGIRRFKETILS